MSAAPSWQLAPLGPLTPRAGAAVRAGTGAPRVLWLHGFLGQQGDWQDIVDLLPRLTHVALDLPGHGAAPPLPDDRPAHATLAAALAAAALNHAAGPWVVVGYSLGARVAMALAPLLARAGRLAACVLVSGHPGLADATDRAARLAVDLARARDLRQRGLAAFVADWYRAPLLADVWQLPPGPALVAARAAGGPDAAEARARTLVALSTGSQPDRLPALTPLATRVTWVAGALDTRYEGLLRRAHAATPGSRLQVVESAGHQLHLTRPSALADLVRSAAQRGAHDLSRGSL